MKTFSIGVDLGGTNLRVAAFTSDYRRIGQSAIATRVSAGPEEVARDICGEIRKLLLICADQGKLQGIGVGSPGPIELPQGKLGAPPNLPGFAGFELKKSLEAMLELPVYVEHDTNAAALAECLRGAGKQHQADSLCMLTLGTGVGGGILLGGKIWHGAHGMAGEVGHIPLFPDGALCSCGGRGCLELYASATGIRRMAAEMAIAGHAHEMARLLDGDAAMVTFELARLAGCGDAPAKRLFVEVGRCLGIGLATLINTLNLPLYVIGGGVANAWHLFAPAMMETLAQFSYVYRLTASNGRTLIVPAMLGSEAGLLGAAMLPYSN